MSNPYEYNANEESDRHHLDEIQYKVDDIRSSFNSGFCSAEAQEKARQIISSLGNI
jgi:hypothetical protein